MAPLPFSVRSAGHYILDAGHVERRNPGAFTQLFWVVCGEGKARLGRRWILLSPGAVFIYEQGEEHELQAGEDGAWNYRWITLDGPHVSSVLKSLGLGRVQHSGPCPENLFRQVNERLHDATPRGERKASLLGYELLLQAASSVPDPSSEAPILARQAREVLDSRFHEPGMNIETLAAQLKVHRTTLYRVFVRCYGVSPIQYLMRIRLGRALERLKESSEPVATIALECGLPDIAYFSKLVKKVTGQSPLHFRAE